MNKKKFIRSTKKKKNQLIDTDQEQFIIDFRIRTKNRYRFWQRGSFFCIPGGTSWACTYRSSQSLYASIVPTCLLLSSSSLIFCSLNYTQKISQATNRERERKKKEEISQAANRERELGFWSNLPCCLDFMRERERERCDAVSYWVLWA